MKKNFLRILPIAVAVLLATSCSKDKDDNTVVENNAAQENVEAVHDFALTVSNGESLSKLSLAGELGGNETKALKYDIGDKLYIALKEEDGAPDFFGSQPLTAEDISADGKEATFHFTQPVFDGKTTDDVEEGFMGGDGDDDPNGLLYTFSKEEYTDPLKGALSFASRRLDVSTWTLTPADWHSVIYLDPATEKKVAVTYWVYDPDTEKDRPMTITLTAGNAYVVNVYEVEVTVGNDSKTVEGGKLYYVK